MTTTVLDVVRAAIPDADEETAEHVLWGRTPYPCGATNARAIYRAASAMRRSWEHGTPLCEFCHRIAMPDESLCSRCDAILRRGAQFAQEVVKP